MNRGRKAGRLRLRSDLLTSLSIVAVSLGLVGPAGAGHDDPAEQRFVEAARSGDLATLEDLVGQGVNVNASQGDGRTALHLAAERRDVEMVEFLLEHGADVERGTRIGDYRALHVASRMGSSAIIERLLEAGATVDVKTTNSGTLPIHLAAESGNPRAVEVLARKGADIDAREGSWGQTPLMFAAARNRAEVIESLVDLGAEPALEAYVVDVPTRAIVDEEAQVRLQGVLDNFREMDGGGDAWSPSPEQVESAIREARDIQRRGGNPTDVAQREEVDEEEAPNYAAMVGGWGGLTALLYASRQGHEEAVVALLEGGADIDQVSGGDGTSPLLIAALSGHFDLAVHLLEQGADPNLASDAGTTPLHAVLEREWLMPTSYSHPLHHFRQDTGYLELMERLLKEGADPNARLTDHLWFLQYNFDRLRMSFEGATPFWRAAFALDLDAMQLLVDYGAESDVWTKRGQDQRLSYGDDDNGDESGVPPVPEGGPAMHAIHAASGVGYGEGYIANVHRHVPDGWLPAIRYLVEERGADVNARDHNGYTPLHHAASRGDDEVVQYLVSQGADVTVISRDGQTTADMANGPFQRISPFPSTIELLENLGAHNNNNCVSC